MKTITLTIVNEQDYVLVLKLAQRLGLRYQEGTPDTPRRYTIEEYFALEEQSDLRHEYYHGEIFPLDDALAAKAGGTKARNRLVQNCAFALKLGLRGRGGEVFAENVRLAIAEGQHYSYPDE